MRAPREDAGRVGGTPPSIARSRSDGAAGTPGSGSAAGAPRLDGCGTGGTQRGARCSDAPSARVRGRRIRRPKAEARVRVGRHRMPGDRGRRAGWPPPAASSQTSHPAAGADETACRASIRRRGPDERWRRFVPMPPEPHDLRPSTSDLGPTPVTAPARLRRVQPPPGARRRSRRVDRAAARDARVARTRRPRHRLASAGTARPGAAVRGVAGLRQGRRSSIRSSMPGRSTARASRPLRWSRSWLLRP